MASDIIMVKDHSDSERGIAMLRNLCYGDAKNRGDGDDSDVAGNIGVIFILIFLLRFKYVVLGTYIS